MVQLNKIILRDATLTLVRSKSVNELQETNILDLINYKNELVAKISNLNEELLNSLVTRYEYCLKFLPNVVTYCILEMN